MRFKVVIAMLIGFHVCFTQDSSKQSYVIKSLLVPGWGNLELNNKTTGYIHIIAEATLWTSYFYYGSQAADLRKQYKTYAKRHLNLTGKYDNAYYRRISVYQSYDQYIEFKQRQGVPMDQIKFDIEPWRWDTADQQGKYSDLRKDAIETDRLPALFIYGMIFNRLVNIFTTNYDFNQIVSTTALNSTSVTFNIAYNF